MTIRQSRSLTIKDKGTIMKKKTVAPLLGKILQKIAATEHLLPKYLRGMDGLTTIVAAVVKNNYAFVQHAGDSRAYLITAKRVKQLTEDHGKGNFLYNSLGSRTKPPEIAQHVPIKLEKGNSLVLCTDGVHRLLTEKEIAEIVQKSGNADEAAKNIIRRVESKGEHENATAVVYFH